MNREKVQRRFWNVVYDRLARAYDAVDWLTANTTHRMRRRALRHLPSPGSRMLEIGFGSGRLAVLREEYGPWGCVHVVAGTRPEGRCQDV